jgi:hypothetical protein
MSGAVLALLDRWPRTDAPLVLWWELCCACVAGFLTYVVTHLVLWRLSGAPPSAERYALRVASGLVDRFWSHRGSGGA